MKLGIILPEAEYDMGGATAGATADDSTVEGEFREGNDDDNKS